MRLRIVLVAAAATVLASASGAGADRSSGAPWRDYVSHGPWIDRVCSLPIPRLAGCDAEVVTDSAGSPLVTSATPPAGAVTPAKFHSAYNLPTTAPGTPTIAIVDAYDDPNIASDLNAFDSQYSLPSCTTTNGCFTKVNQSGGTSYPASNSGWSLEISLDVETAHSICQNCKILLVEASSASLANLGTAENEAVKLGATVISNSWGASEYSSETSDDSSYFNHPGVPITASAGDSGYGVEFPAASQYVTAVGGTTLNLNSNGSWSSETVWNGTGSGCSAYETKPSWQKDPTCKHRMVNDVSADADPNTGAAVYDTVSYSGQTGWFQVGGTSLAAPLIASVYALTGTASSVVAGSAPYANPGALHDVTSGSNGSCSGTYYCTATSGYDGPTGLGTPNGIGAFAAGSASVTTPGAPGTLTANAGSNLVSLSWSAPSNNGGATVSGYNVYRGTTPGGESSTPLASGVTSTTYNDTTAVNGTTYYYTVAAVNSAGAGTPSNEVNATPATTPGAPGTLTANAGSNLVSLSWSAPSSNGGATVSGYNVYRGTTPGGESGTPLASGVTSTSYIDTTAANGTTYYYTVAALNRAGTGATSNEAKATPQAVVTTPGAPGTLSASAGNSLVSLSWSQPSNNGGGSISGYNVYRGTTPNGESASPLASGVTSTSYNDATAANGTTYYYKVTAVNSAGEGTASNEASATPQAVVTTPGAPGTLSASAGNSLVSLSWSQPSNNGGGSISGYNVYRGTTPNGESSTPLATGVTSTSYNDTTAVNGTTYYYKVTAVNSAGEGTASNEASATPQATVTVTKPGPPVSLGASASSNSVSLSWSQPSNNGGGSISGYNVYRGTTPNGESASPLASGVTSTSYNDTTAANGTTYYYKVTAVNSVGEGTASNEASATPQAVVTTPGAPGTLSASAGNSLVSLSWSQPSNNGGGSISGYNVYRGTTPNGESSTPLATGVTSTSYNDTTAVNGTTYYYKVAAVNSAGAGASSNEASAAPTAPNAGDFSLSISPTNTQTIGSSGSVNYTITITPTGGFNGSVTLSVGGLPVRVSGSFSTNPATTTSTLTVTASSARYSRATLTITGVSGSISHSVSVSLWVF